MDGRIVRSGPLTWSQIAMWHPLFWRHHGGRFPLKPQAWYFPEKVSVAAALAAWAAMVRRHESLRSSFGVSSTGHLVQRVTHPDDFTAPITTAPLAEYEAFIAGNHRLDFDGPLWSVTIFHENGIAYASGLLAEHILYDAGGLENWREQIGDLLVDPHRQVHVPRHPIDMANAEPMPDHPRVRKARDRFQESLPRSAQVPIPTTRQANADRYLRSTATYVGLAGTVAAIARRCHGSQPAVLTYAVGWLIARLARHRWLPVDLLYANRSPREQTIGCQMEHVFFDVDFGPASPSVAIKELARTTIGAFAHGRMPRNLAAAVRSTASVERGVDIKEPIMFNVLSGSDKRFDIDRAANPDTVIHEWSPGGTPFVNMIVIVAFDDHIEITLDVDGAMFTQEDTTAVLADLPKAIAHLHDTPDQPLADHTDWSTTPFPLDDGLVRVGQDWVRPHKVADLIAKIPGVHTAEVHVTGDHLTATVTHDDTLSYFDIHEHLLTTVATHADVVVPTRYRSSPSTTPWHVRDRPVIPPTTGPELALYNAIRHTHGFTVDDFGHTYVTAGCDLDLVPALVMDLNTRGYLGLNATMFTAPFTLRTIARALTQVPGTP